MKIRAIVFPTGLLAVAFALAQAPVPNPWKKRVLTKDILTEGLAAPNRKDGGTVHWQSEVIDADSGVGCQVLAVDLDGDGTLEFAAGSKKGVHVIGR